MSRGCLVGCCLLVLASAGAAQPARVTGTVVDAETGAPLPGANVFVAGTSRGASTDRAGAFELVLEAPTAARVTATMLGYETASAWQLLQPGDAVEAAFRLRPNALALDGVEVSVERDAEWERARELFEAVFLGGTPNGRRASLENPEVVDLTYADGVLRAEGVAPLVVANPALGYRLTVHDLELAASGDGWGWDGVVAFEDVCGAACPPTVEAARAEAYAGSLHHFLRALAAGRVEAEGFEALTVSAPGQGRSPWNAARRLFGRADPPPASLLTAAPDGWTLRTAPALRVRFRGEPNALRGQPGPQTSWLASEDGAVRVGPDGTLLEDDAVRYGYWDWERIADAVPLDYGR